MKEVSKKSTVYYVEDEPDLVDLCNVAFKASGILMVSASTGEEALVYLNEILSGNKLAPDAFILDILLPGISGIEIMEKIRSYAELDSVPIIIFTNYSDDKIKEVVKKAKNATYVLKTDIIPTQLVNLVMSKIA